jgi:hypothetical protein
MSFLVGKTRQDPNVTGDTRQAHAKLLQFLLGQGGEGLNRLFPGSEVDPKALQPYLDLFTQQNTKTFGQAKESAGNLTGSGFGNILGNKAAEASTMQGGFLADLFERRRAQDQSIFANTLIQGLGSPAGGVTNSYQPGFLDYATQAASSIAPAFGAGGFTFGSLGLGGGGGGRQGYQVRNQPRGNRTQSGGY